MEKIIEIKSINLNKLSIGEYAQFIGDVIKLASKSTLEQIGIKEELFASLQKNSELLTEVIGQNYASQETKQLLNIDKERSKLAVFLLSSFRLERNNIDENRKESATILYEATKNYIGVQTFPVRSKTQFINSMVNDLNKPNNKDLLSVLGLTKTLNVLDEKNQAYQQLSQGRAENQLANPLVSFQQIKKETNSLYKDLTRYAFAYNLLHQSSESLNFVNLLNKLIDNTINANKQRLSQSVANKIG